MMEFREAHEEGVAKASMKAVTVEKDKLLEQLRTNRGLHQEQYQDAMDGYRTRAVALLHEHIAKIEAGTVEDVDLQLDRPRSFAADYDRAIEMLEWTLEDVVTLTAAEFDQYVRDQWSWKREFVASTRAYLG